MGNLAIIPARGGSKRIPRKNIRDFLGKPIIAYSIEVAKASNIFDDIIVSTDDLEIASIAKQYGANVPFMRSDVTSDDYSTLGDVIEEVKISLGQRMKNYSNTCCILPTAPLVTSELILQGYHELIATGADSVRPLVKFRYPIQRALALNKDGKFTFFFPEYRTTRSQDLDSTYHDAGMFYWMKSEAGLLGQDKNGFEISDMLCQDIDDETDWKLAELKYKVLNC